MSVDGDRWHQELWDAQVEFREEPLVEIRAAVQAFLFNNQRDKRRNCEQFVAAVAGALGGGGPDDAGGVQPVANGKKAASMRFGWFGGTQITTGAVTPAGTDAQTDSAPNAPSRGVQVRLRVFHGREQAPRMGSCAASTADTDGI